jgi:hypothetical protein
MSGTVLTTGILRLARQTATIDCRMKPPLAAAVGLIFCRSLLCQPTMPSWLTPYPGATAQMKASPSLVEATYTTDAPPDVVTAHYGKLFETQNLDFHPNLDGIGAMIRGDASECNLLITIHPQSTGTFVRVGCAAKNRSFTSANVPSAVPGPAVPAGIMERHTGSPPKWALARRSRQPRPCPWSGPTGWCTYEAPDCRSSRQPTPPEI